MCAMLAEPAAPAAAPIAPPVSVEPAVRVEGLNHFYGEGAARNQVLFDNHLEVPPGELVVMTGPSGAGKTTLLTLIGGLRSVQAGRVEVLGRDLSRLKPRDLVEVRREIGFVFQMHNLFDALTAYENVKMAMQLGHDRPDARRSAASSCSAASVLAIGSTTSRGSLSGGERQRVAIARALVNRPRLVLADEPTAALDAIRRESSSTCSNQMTVEHDSAVLMVTHDYRIIKSADRLVHMVDGRIVSDVVLHDALRICEFLRAVDLFRALTPTQLTACRREDDKAPFRGRRDDHPRGRDGRGVFPDLRRAKSTWSAQITRSRGWGVVISLAR